MKFTDFSPNSLVAINNYLADKSYVEGYVPSSSDVDTFSGIGNAAPDANKYPNVSRWWNHIKSFSDSERSLWPVVGSNAGSSSSAAAPAPASSAKKEDDFDLFEESADDEWEQEIQKRADEHAAKKKAKDEAAGKAPNVMKSAVVLDVKPWEDTTDLVKMEELVRQISIEGLEWKASKLVPIGYGIKKLQISCHIEDEKVSVDDIQEKIEAFSELVQSTDIQSFTKL